MPERPPVFRPVGWQERKPWAKTGKPATERIRGRRGQKLRAEVLAEEPFCRACLAKGLHVQAQVVDHIVPLAFGGLEARVNRQALCHPCHDQKTALESAQGSDTGSAHPDWLRPAQCELTIVCGPPMAGKDEYVTRRAGPGELVIGLDQIRRDLFKTWRPYGTSEPEGLLGRALRVRNSLLASLGKPGHRERAWLIVGAPSAGEREWWLDKLGGELVLLDPGLEECKRRAAARGTPGAVRAIERWYAASQLPFEAQ